ncbi:MAG: efflux RND transporter periplasmic adaptor subunit [Bacteroidetes bacterium]|nr:efflux RND transporter periplasmic adaptor subunit [Bacteroidota bacterium]
MNTHIYIITLLLTSVFMVSCESKKAPEEAQTEVINSNLVTLTDAQLANTRIKTGKASTKNIATVLKVNGKVDVPPQNMVSISAPMGGYLKQTSLLPGMHVNKGQVLATLEDQQYIQMQQSFLSSQVKVNVLNKDYQRQLELNKEQASSDKVMQQAKAALDQETVNMNALKATLQMIGINTNGLRSNQYVKTVSLKSPIDGYVSKVNVNIGKYVTPSEVIFDLINPTDIHLNLQLFEKNISRLSVGQQLICYAPSHPEKKYHCQIILISKDVNANKTIDVHCHFSEYDHTLLPGMYLTAEIEINAYNGLSVPEQAVVFFEGTHYIFVAKDKYHFTLSAVETGENENGFISVKSLENIDFNTTDIVLEDAYTLLMKLKNTEE